MRTYQLLDGKFFGRRVTRSKADQYTQEDAATAEVSRSQLWQWCRHGVTTAEGKKVDKAYAQKLLKEQADELASKAPKGNKYQLAAQYFAGQVTGEGE